MYQRMSILSSLVLRLSCVWTLQTLHSLTVYIHSGKPGDEAIWCVCLRLTNGISISICQMAGHSLASHCLVFCEPAVLFWWQIQLSHSLVSRLVRIASNNVYIDLLRAICMFELRSEHSTCMWEAVLTPKLQQELTQVVSLKTKTQQIPLSDHQCSSTWSICQIVI